MLVWQKWPVLVASVFAKIEQSLNGAKWRGNLPFDQDIDCVHHVHGSFLSEKAELIVLNYRVARIRALSG